MGKRNPDFLASATLRELLDARSLPPHRRPAGLRDAIRTLVAPVAADVRSGRLSLSAVDFATLQGFSALAASVAPVGYDAELRSRPEALAIREANRKVWEDHWDSRATAARSGRAGPSHLGALLDGLTPAEAQWQAAVDVQRRRAAFQVIEGGRA